MQVERLEAIATPLVNKFYQAHSVRGRANKQDQVWVVKAPTLIAACRLQDRKSSLFLSTLYVEPQSRGQGVAKRLVLDALAAQQQTVFTFPYRHLESFYQSLGFTQSHSLPCEIDTLFTAYRQQGRDIIAMTT